MKLGPTLQPVIYSRLRSMTVEAGAADLFDDLSPFFQIKIKFIRKFWAFPIAAIFGKELFSMVYRR